MAKRVTVIGKIRSQVSGKNGKVIANLHNEKQEVTVSLKRLCVRKHSSSFGAMAVSSLDGCNNNNLGNIHVIIPCRRNFLFW